MPIDLNSLLVTQNDLRHWKTIKEMAEYVRNGGFWTEEYLKEYSKSQNLSRVSPLIAISKFEDNLEYLHDGHHRSVATWLGGRDYLRDDEYTMTNWLYKDYTDFVPENNWFTPFDPRTHVRNADFAQFKAEVKRMLLAPFSRLGEPEEVLSWIEGNKDRFLRRRDAYQPKMMYVSNLANRTWWEP